MPNRGIALLVLLVVAGLTGGAGTMTPRAQATLEYSVKANYLVRFAAFVDWPARAFSSAQAPVVICVLGRDPFGAGLDRAASAQSAHGRALVVRRPQSRAAVETCHIAYVGDGGAALLGERSGLLEVTDSTVGSRRGVVHFVVSEGRVRFHIDLDDARRQGLAISSRLLNLAVSVEGG
jgi:hypothetical protein